VQIRARSPVADASFHDTEASKALKVTVFNLYQSTEHYFVGEG